MKSCLEEQGDGVSGDIAVAGRLDRGVPLRIAIWSLHFLFDKIPLAVVIRKMLADTALLRGNKPLADVDKSRT
jgi:hypothetical protein